jgi:hypothetical protein
MCVLIAKPGGIVIDEQLLRTAWKYNNDGGGIAFIDDEKGELVIKKGFDKVDEFLAEITANNHRSLIIHFRRGSPGMKKDAKNCHPFAISVGLDAATNTYRYSYAVAHNGRLEWRHTDDHSDTSCFVHDYLTPALEADPLKFDRDLEVVMLERAINSTEKNKYTRPENKIVMIRYDRETKNGKFTIVGEELGKWHEKVWYSNEEPWRKEYKAPVAYGLCENWDDYRTEYKKKYDDALLANAKAFGYEPGCKEISLGAGKQITQQLKEHFEKPDAHGWAYDFTLFEWVNAGTGVHCKVLSSRQDPFVMATAYYNALINHAPVQGKSTHINPPAGDLPKSAPHLPPKTSVVKRKYDHIIKSEQKQLCAIVDSFLHGSTHSLKQHDKIPYLREVCKDLVPECKEMDGLNLDCWMIARAKEGTLLLTLIKYDQDETEKMEAADFEHNRKLIALNSPSEDEMLGY